MHAEQEQTLIELAKTDGNAFGELYDMYYPKIFNYILRRTANVVITEDITTDVFMKALDRIHTFTWRGVPFSAWLYRIAGNEIANHYRNKHNQHLSLEALMEDQGFEPVSDIDIEEAHIAEQEKLERHKLYVLYVHVQHALTDLPLIYQEVLALRYFEKKTIAQISTIVNKQPGTVKSLLSRGTKKLRTTLQPFSPASVYTSGDKKS